MKLTTHQLAKLLLAGVDQPVYTCDYAGDNGELVMYPVVCVDSNIVQNGTIICTGEDCVPYHEFTPVDLPLDDGPLTLEQVDAIHEMNGHPNETAWGEMKLFDLGCGHDDLVVIGNRAGDVA